MVTPSVVNGHTLYALEVFQQEFDRLVDLVEKLENKDPNGFVHHPYYKLFVAVYTNITESIPENPNAKQYRLGKTLGSSYTSWRRVKKQTLPDRYRLFFRFSSTQPKAIIYAWLNDEFTLRKEGAKTDCYNTFKKMLKNNKIPTSLEELLRESNLLVLEDEDDTA